MPSIFEDFLDYTHEQAERLAADSDVMRLTRVRFPGIGLWIAEFAIPYLCRLPDGAVRVAPGPIGAAIRLGPEFLRSVSPLEVVQIREVDLLHPNVRWPVLCLGQIRPGMPLPHVLRQVFEILTYVNIATDDGLDPLACRLLCEQPELLNLLPRAPRLVRRQLVLTAEGRP